MAIPAIPRLTSNVGTFFMWCPTVGAADTHGHVPFGTSSPNVAGHQIYPDLSSVGSNSPSSGSLPSWFNTKNRSIVFASGGTAETCKVFLDGKQTGLTWSGAPAAWGSGNKNFNLGRYVGGTLWDFGGTILIAGYTSAVWGDAESRAFHENPSQLLKSRTRRLWASSSGGIAHHLAGATSTQPNEGNAAAIAQHHALVGLPSVQAGVSNVEAITQDQILAIASSSQLNASSTGAITATLSLVAPPEAQMNTSATARGNAVLICCLSQDQHKKAHSPCLR